MNYTNIFDLPSCITEAVIRDARDRDAVGKISVTELIGPPMLRQLRNAYSETACEDVSDQIYALLGKSVHAALADANVLGATSERWLTAPMLGWDVTGIPDCVDRDGWLNDFKVVSAFAFLLGDKPEWEAQLNVYDYLCRVNGIEVTAGLRIIAIVRDWSAYQAKRDPRWPQCPVVVKPVRRWTHEEQEKYLYRRVLLHQTWEGRNIADVPVCTPEERWQSETQFAVVRQGNKKAMRVLSSEAEAITFVAQQDPKFQYRIDVREAEPKRCQSYCAYNVFCPFGKQFSGGDLADETE